MPHKLLPRKLVEYLGMSLARKLNYFQAKYGFSECFSPRVILHQENLDFKQHCICSTCEHAQEHSESTPSSTNTSRTLDCNYLRTSNDSQGGYGLLHLATNRVIN